MITIREYAESHHVSYEAVRSQVARYREQLDPHISVKNRTIFLDTWAVEFLDERRREHPVTVLNDNREAEIEELKAQVERLKAVVADIQEDRNRAQLKIEQLQDEARGFLEEKIRHELVLKEYEQNKEQLTDALTKASAAESRLEEVRARLDDSKAEAARLLEERDAAIRDSQSYRRTWFGLYRKG